MQNKIELIEEIVGIFPPDKDGPIEVVSGDLEAEGVLAKITAVTPELKDDETRNPKFTVRYVLAANEADAKTAADTVLDLTKLPTEIFVGKGIKLFVKPKATIEVDEVTGEGEDQTTEKVTKEVKLSEVYKTVDVEFSYEKEIPPTKEEIIADEVSKGLFDEAKSTIAAAPGDVIADGARLTDVTVTLFSKSYPEDALNAVAGVELIGADGTVLTDRVTGPTVTGNKYVFKVKALGAAGTDNISFKTKGATSAKKTSIKYIPDKAGIIADDVSKGLFADKESTITVVAGDVIADGKRTTDVVVTLFSKSYPTDALNAVKDVELIGTDGTVLTGRVSAPVVAGNKYTFKVTALSAAGTDNISFKTKGGTSTKKIAVKYIPDKAGIIADDVAKGLFADAQSTIISAAGEGTIKGDGASKTKITVTLLSKSYPSDPLNDVKNVQVIGVDGTDLTGRVSGPTVTGNKYEFEITALDDAGTDTFTFKTAGATSTKKASIKYVIDASEIGPSTPNKDGIIADEASKGLFNIETSDALLSNNGENVIADEGNTKTSVEIELFSLTYPDDILLGVTSLKLEVLEGSDFEDFASRVTGPIVEDDKYIFQIATPNDSGKDKFTFKTDGQTSEKEYSINYTIKGMEVEPGQENIPLQYFEVLLGRDSSTIFMGYWVIDEIKRLNDAGIDWKVQANLDKYKSEILTIAKMCETTTEVEIVESRNGRILNKKDLGL